MRRNPGFGRFALFTALIAATFASFGGERAASPAAGAGLPDGRQEEFVPGEIIVELAKPAAERARGRMDSSHRVKGARIGDVSFDALGSRLGVSEIRAAGAAPDGRAPAAFADFFLVRLSQRQDALEALREYRKQAAVKSAQLNYLYTPDLAPNDPLYSQQYAHQRTSAEAGWDIQTGDPAIVVAVIGQGVELTHPDLQANLVPGYDFFAGDADPSPDGAFESHETSVAGVIAAVTDNALGVAGVCWGCRVMPLRVGVETYSSIRVAQAIDFAVANGARVVNMSFGSDLPGGFGPDTLVETAINNGYASNVVMVSTAGNVSTDIFHYPGALQNVIAVSATDSVDQRSSFSSFGSWVDVAAPGTSVLSTTLTSLGGYASVSGTSFSAPYVAGLAGLLLSEDPTLTSAEVRFRIEYSADHVPTDHTIGSGRVDVAQALAPADPDLFAAIKAPIRGALAGSAAVEIRGTALGTSYTLEYRPGPTSPWTQFATGSETIEGTLGYLDASVIPFLTFYDVRLTAFRAGDVDQDQITLFQGGPSGWRRAAGSNWHSAVHPVDLDADGQREVLVGSYALGPLAWRHDGSLSPGFPAVTGGLNDLTSPAVGDIDGNGDLEIVAISLGDPEVMAWHHTGVAVGGFPRNTFVPPSGVQHYWGSPTLANLDADTALEMILPSISGIVNVLNADGTSVSGWPKTLDSNVQTTAAVGDVDGDGQVEIVIRQYQKIYAFEAGGSDVPGWPRARADVGNVSPALGGLNGDAGFDVLTAETRSIGNLGFVSALDGGGNTLFTRQFPSPIRMQSFAVGDVNLDGYLEIFIGDDGGRVLGLDSEGNSLPSWPVSVGANIGGSPVIADIDGDGQKEIVAGAQDGTLHAWRLNGTPAIAPIPLAASIVQSPAVADLDGDGDVELIAACSDGSVYAIDLPGAWDPLKADWPTFQNDSRHSGLSNLDTDGDGEPNITDCGPANPQIHHGATETCNLVDDDCDGAVDEGFDWDEDGFTTCGGDCNDFAWFIYPGAPELCNSYDDDCDGSTDEGFDGDGDGYPGCGQDCNDANAAIHPGAVEICNLVDDDCDAQVDEGSAFDQDGDGFTVCEGDCADNDPRINGVEQGGLGWPNISCWDGLDNDCDGTTDWDCALAIGDEHLEHGNRSPSSGFGPMHPGSADNTYVTYTEKSPGKKLIGYWTMYVPPNSTSIWYDLLVEAHRSPINGNDTFNVSWAKRNQSGECTHTSGETYTAALSVTRTSDPAGDPRLQAFQLGPPSFDTQAFCVKIVDSAPSGDNNPTDSLNVDRLYLMPVLLHVRAVSEFTTTGSRINGTSYIQTQNPDEVYEKLRESAAPQDALNHTWRFNVPIGFSHQLHVEAWRTNGDPNDNFQLYYATPSPGDPNQPGSFQLIPNALIDVAIGGINADFPFGPNHTLTGAVWIRVMDTVSPGSLQQTLNVDYMSIKTTP